MTDQPQDQTAQSVPATQQAPPEATLPAPKRERLISNDDGQAAHLMDTARFEQAQRVAMALASSAFLPLHLRDKEEPSRTAANCFRVVNQALLWGMDPFGVADETYAVSGRIGYQGKLVAAVVNSRAGLRGRLSATYEGTGDGRTVTITGQFKNEETPRDITLSVAQAKTSNTMWTKDPDQKLYYSAVVKWARRHCPEVVLGVLTDDDVDRIAESKQPPPPSMRSFTNAEMDQAISQLKHRAITIDMIKDSVPNLDPKQLEKLSAVEPID